MWYYSVDDSECRHECKTTWLDLEIVAVRCAEDFHSNHDGWEYSWPLDIYLYETVDGPSVAKASVEREVEPVFYARILK